MQLKKYFSQQRVFNPRRKGPVEINSQKSNLTRMRYRQLSAKDKQAVKTLINILWKAHIQKEELA